MGVGIDSQTLMKRSDKLAFMQVVSGGSFSRMEGFTDLGTSNNAQTYDRRYVDEDSSRVSVMGYAPSISYTFDRYVGNAVLEKIVDIHDNLRTGSDAVVTIVQVDMSTFMPSGTGVVDGGTATGYLQKYTVQPDGDGSTTDALTYSGTLSANGVRQTVTVTFTAGGNFQSCSIAGSSGLAVTSVKVYRGDGTLFDTLNFTESTNLTLYNWTSASQMKLEIFTDVASSTTYAKKSDNTYFVQSDGKINLGTTSAGDSVTVYGRVNDVFGYANFTVSADAAPTT